VTGYAGRAIERPVRPRDLLRAGLDANPDGLALISADTRWTWRTLEDLTVNFLWAYVYITDAPAGHVSRVWFDDIVVATQYIGPLKRK